MPNNIPNSKDILLQILTIIDYKDNKEAFADQFLQVSLQEAFAKVISTLPPEKQLLLEKELDNKKPDEKSYILLQDYVKPHDYAQIMTRSMQDFLNDYIKEVEPTLSSDQKQKLSEYLDSIRIKFVNSLTPAKD